MGLKEGEQRFLYSENRLIFILNNNNKKKKKKKNFSLKKDRNFVQFLK